jgi:hypothetical protein
MYSVYLLPDLGGSPCTMAGTDLDQVTYNNFQDFMSSALERPTDHQIARVRTSSLSPYLLGSFSIHSGFWPARAMFAEHLRIHTIARLLGLLVTPVPIAQQTVMVGHPWPSPPRNENSINPAQMYSSMSHVLS